MSNDDDTNVSLPIHPPFDARPSVFQTGNQGLSIDLKAMPASTTFATNYHLHL